MNKTTLYLRQKRLEKELTIQNVADKLGISFGSYSHKERGITKFNIDEIKKLSKILTIPSDEIVSIFLS